MMRFTLLAATAAIASCLAVMPIVTAPSFDSALIATKVDELTAAYKATLTENFISPPAIDYKAETEGLHSAIEAGSKALRDLPGKLEPDEAKVVNDAFIEFAPKLRNTVIEIGKNLPDDKSANTNNARENLVALLKVTKEYDSELLKALPAEYIQGVASAARELETAFQNVVYKDGLAPFVPPPPPRIPIYPDPQPTVVVVRTSSVCCTS